MFAALGSDDESDSRPVAQSITSKTEPKAAKHDNAAPRGGRGGDRGERGGRGGRGGARGGRGRGGAARGGYSNEDGLLLLKSQLMTALKESADVRANRERDVSEPRPRGGSRGARATGGGRGREHDRHSATGRVYVAQLNVADVTETLRKLLIKAGAMKPLRGNLLLQLLKPIERPRKRRPVRPPPLRRQRMFLSRRLRRSLTKSQYKHTPITLQVK